MEELQVFRSKLDLSVKKIDDIWVPFDNKIPFNNAIPFNNEKIFEEVGVSEEGSTGSKCTMVEKEEEEVVKEPARLRSGSWNSIDEWLGQVHYAATELGGLEPMVCHAVLYPRQHAGHD